MELNVAQYDELRRGICDTAPHGNWKDGFGKVGVGVEGGVWALVEAYSEDWSVTYKF